jgi:hypothetical protein
MKKPRILTSILISYAFSLPLTVLIMKAADRAFWTVPVSALLCGTMYLAVHMPRLGRYYRRLRTARRQEVR